MGNRFQVLSQKKSDSGACAYSGADRTAESGKRTDMAFLLDRNQISQDKSPAGSYPRASGRESHQPERPRGKKLSRIESRFRISRSDPPRFIHDPADTLHRQFVMQAAVRAENISRLASLGNHGTYFLFDLFLRSGIQERAGPVVKSSPDRAAEMFFCLPDIHDIKLSGPADYGRLVVLPDGQAVRILLPCAEMNGVHAAQAVGIIQHGLVAGRHPVPCIPLP